MIRRICWLGLVLAPLSGCGRMELSKAQASFHQTADVQGVRLAHIETRNGSIQVDTIPGNQVEVSGSRYAYGATAAQAQQRLDQISIRIERQADHPDVLHIVADFHSLEAGSPGASFQIGLPANVELDLTTSNASITTSQRRQNVKAVSSNGSITAERIDGDVWLKTSNASVAARGVTGDVEAISSNGRVQLERVGAQRVRANTSNASITAVEPRGTVTLVSSNGSVNLLASQPLTGLDIRTSNAGATVRLPRTIKGTLQLNTSNASVHTNLRGAQINETHSDRHTFSATLNGGGEGLFNTRTSNGSIRFELIDSAPATEQAERPAVTN